MEYSTEEYHPIFHKQMGRLRDFIGTTVSEQQSYMIYPVRKLCEYTDAKRHAQQHDLGPGDNVFVANTKSGKLIPTFGHQRYVIVHSKGPDTFELVHAETGQRLICNVKFLSRVPSMELSLNGDDDTSCLESEEFREAAMPPLDQLETTVSDDRNPASSGPADSAKELRHSTRTPKPKRDADFVYY